MENMEIEERPKVILVTGATGFIGSALCSKLLQNHKVIAFIRDWHPKFTHLEECEIVHGKLENYSDIIRAINQYEVDTIVHLGAQTLVGSAFHNPYETFESNIKGTYNLLEACRMARKNMVKRIIIASSDKAYGSARILPYTEDTPLHGEFPYDVSKSCADLLAQSYAKTYDLPIAITRCANIYGGGDLNFSRLIPGTIKSILQNTTPIIRSNGMFTRDYLYISDVVDAYVALINTKAIYRSGEAFNVSSETQVSVLEIVNTILKLMDKESIKPIVLNNIQAEIQDQHLDSSKAKNILCWSPKHSLEQGLSNTIQWYERNLPLCI